MSTVSYSPLRSEYGFESPGFLVSPTGKITISSGEPQVFEDRVNMNDELYVADQIYIDNIALLDLSDPLVNKLGSGITESFLTRLATLQELYVSGNVDIESAAGNKNITIVDGTITVVSTALGTINNMSIGLTTPAAASFRNVEVGQVGNNAVLTVNGTASITVSASIPTLNTTEITATDIEADDVVINNTPVEAFHSTRKDYVDNRITALSIALGA